MKKEDGRTTFETTLPEQRVPPTPRGREGTPFVERSEVVYTRHESRVLTFCLPVKGFELFFEHPPGLSPEVIVFGVGGPEVTDPLPPVHASSTHHHWRYTGWLLESSGVVLTFSRPKGAA